MRIPIRMLGVATTILWIFLVAFFASAAYSVRDMHFYFGEPQVSITDNNRVVFSLNVTVTNGGFYNIGSFNITTETLNKQGIMIARNSTFIPVIRRGEQVTAIHNVTVNIDDLSQGYQNDFVNDTELIINEIVSMTIAEVIPIQGSTSFSVPLPASVYKFNYETLVISCG